MDLERSSSIESEGAVETKSFDLSLEEIRLLESAAVARTAWIMNMIDERPNDPENERREAEIKILGELVEKFRSE